MALRRLVHGLTLAASLTAAGLLAVDRWVAHTDIPPLALETSATVLDRNGDLLRAYTVVDGRWRLPVAIDAVDRQRGGWRAPPLTERLQIAADK